MIQAGQAAFGLRQLAAERGHAAGGILIPLQLAFDEPVAVLYAAWL